MPSPRDYQAGQDFQDHISMRNNLLAIRRFPRVPKNDILVITHIFCLPDGASNRRVFVRNIPTGFNNTAQGCGTPLPWVSDTRPPPPFYPNGVASDWYVTPLG